MLNKVVQFQVGVVPKVSEGDRFLVFSNRSDLPMSILREKLLEIVPDSVAEKAIVGENSDDPEGVAVVGKIELGSRNRVERILSDCVTFLVGESEFVTDILKVNVNSDDEGKVSDFEK
jgi:hypothetical protein